MLIQNSTNLYSFVTVCTDDVAVPSGPSDNQIQQVSKFLGIDEKGMDTKSLALVAFLYLFGAITPKEG